MKIKLGQLKSIITEEVSRAMSVSEADGVDVEQAALSVLSNVFTSHVRPDDVQFIRFMPTKSAVWLHDVGGMLGHIQTSAGEQELDNAGLTVDEFAEWLASNGAKAMKY